MHRTPVPPALALLLSLAACGSDSVGSDDPADATCPGASVPLCIDAAYAGRVTLAVDDAVDRLAPSLSAGARDALLPDLQALATALGAGNVTDASHAAQGLRTSLTAERASAPAADLPSLDAIALAVIQAESSVGLTPSPLQRATP